MNSLIKSSKDVFIAYDYIKQVYINCDNNDLAPAWEKLLDKFLKKLNELSGDKYFKSMFMQDLKSIQCRSPISRDVFDRYFQSTQPHYIYNDLAIDIMQKLISSDTFAVERKEYVYAFNSSPQHIAYMLLNSGKKHSAKILIRLFIECENFKNPEEIGLTKQDLRKIRSSYNLAKDMIYLLKCVNSSFASINPDDYKQQFEDATNEIISNTEFVGLGSEEEYKRAVMSGFSKYAYRPRPKVVVEEPLIEKDIIMHQVKNEEKANNKTDKELQTTEEQGNKTSGQHYVMMINEIDALTEILINRLCKKQNSSKNDACYLFNELDFLLCKRHSTDNLIKVLEARISGYFKNIGSKRYTRNQLERTLKFLISANKASRPNAINTQIEFIIGDQIVSPTQEQIDYVKDYLRQNKVAVNEITYTYALRRLMLGGDINSKFDTGCLVKQNELIKSC